MCDWPAIFYSPHQDDEAIGMGGAIREHKEAGRPVYLVLLTNGVNDGLLKILKGEVFCEWHQTFHNFHLSMEQLTWARNVEFVASAMRLGVDRIYIVEDGRGLDDAEACDPLRYDRFVDRVVDVIRRFEASFPGASHKLVSGPLDPLPDGSTTATHTACWDAALKLRDRISDFRFYRVNVYGHPATDRTAAFTLDLEPEWRAAKREALNQYMLFDPDAGRFAIGYHSVGIHNGIGLIDAALDDCHEYIDLLP